MAKEKISKKEIEEILKQEDCYTILFLWGLTLRRNRVDKCPEESKFYVASNILEGSILLALHFSAIEPKQREKYRNEFKDIVNRICNIILVEPIDEIDPDNYLHELGIYSQIEELRSHLFKCVDDYIPTEMEVKVNKQLDEILKAKGR